MKPTSVRVVILNYNQAAMTVRCAIGALSQSYEPKEVIVVDNASRPTDYETLRRSLPRDVILIRSGHNRGYAAGNNIGARYKSGEDMGEIVLVLNNDAFFTKPTDIEELVSALKSSDEAVACSPLVHNPLLFPNGLSEHEMQVRRDPDYLACLVSGSWWLRRLPYFNSIARRHVYDDERPYIPGRIYKCESINGACFAIKREFLQRIGYLDEGTFLYFEELVLARQIKLNSKTCYLVTSVVVDHHQGTSTGQQRGSTPFKMYREYIKSQVYYAKKYLGVGRLLRGLLIAIRVFDYASKSIIMAVIGNRPTVAK